MEINKLPIVRKELKLIIVKDPNKDNDYDQEGIYLDEITHYSDNGGILVEEDTHPTLIQNYFNFDVFDDIIKTRLKDLFD